MHVMQLRISEAQGKLIHMQTEKEGLNAFWASPREIKSTDDSL